MDVIGVLMIFLGVQSFIFSDVLKCWILQVIKQKRDAHSLKLQEQSLQLYQRQILFDFQSILELNQARRDGRITEDEYIALSAGFLNQRGTTNGVMVYKDQA